MGVNGVQTWVLLIFFFQAEDGIRDIGVTGVQTCALPICVTLHDALTVLQRSEMVTRMAVEIERYIVELGTEGRLIEMQLEEMLTGVAADRSALVKDYIVDTGERSEERRVGKERRSRWSPH